MLRWSFGRGTVRRVDLLAEMPDEDIEALEDAGLTEEPPCEFEALHEEFRRKLAPSED